MQINIHVSTQNEANIKAILPTGYYPDQVGDRVFKVMSDNNEKVALITGFYGPTVVEFMDSESGNKFIQAWGLKWPAYNPMTEVSAFIYRSELTGLYQLDKRPIPVIGQNMEIRKRYVAAGNCFYAYFYLGNWTETSLLVNRIGRFELTGEVEVWTGPETLALGNIENENTM